MIEIIVNILLYVSGGFAILGAIGMVRFPDFYTRTHPATMITVGGVVLGLFALFLSQAFQLSMYSWKILLVMFLIMVLNPAGTHAIAAAAYKSGQKPKLAAGVGKK
jgi:multicomponent Na+:H+ antiporter subunit G